MYCFFEPIISISIDFLGVLFNFLVQCSLPKLRGVEVLLFDDKWLEFNDNLRLY